MVRRNSEQLHKVEEMMMKICNTVETIPENTLLCRTHGHTATSHHAAAKVCRLAPVLSLSLSSHDVHGLQYVNELPS